MPIGGKRNGPTIPGKEGLAAGAERAVAAKAELSFPGTRVYPVHHNFRYMTGLGVRELAFACLPVSQRRTAPGTPQPLKGNCGMNTNERTRFLARTGAIALV